MRRSTTTSPPSSAAASTTPGYPRSRHREGQQAPNALAVGDGQLYWANFEGTIVEANLNGTNATTIATNQHIPDGLAVGP